MSVAPPSVAEILEKHVLFTLEGIDRMYLNAMVPRLQREEGVAWFLRGHRGARFASSALLDPISKQFVRGIEELVEREQVPLIAFERGQRKDDVTKEQLKRHGDREGVIYVGRAQEKVRVVRTQKRRNPVTGAPYPWLSMSTAMVNQFYFYALDADFGPFFLKFSSYFPYNAKLCINGHEYVKRQLAKEGIAFEALDNGLLSCADVGRAQQLCEELSAEKIDGLLRKWLARLPHPFTPADRAAGYRYELFVLQAEFSRTQVLDRPVAGRHFFEQVIRDNLDIGRPDQVQLIFNRHVTRRTPGVFRTRVITEGVTPTLHADYKNTRIKQYHKEGRALRTETTINNTRDFQIGKSLKNLQKLREIGFEANRRLLSVERATSDCTIGEDAFDRVHKPAVVDGQRAPALRFGDPLVLALFAALVFFRLQPRGFTNRDLREMTAHLLGSAPDQFSAGRMTYNLRRLKLHGLIQRVPRSRRYRVTDDGLRIAVFESRLFARTLAPGLAELFDPAERWRDNPQAPFARLAAGIDHLLEITATGRPEWVAA
jgi:hypothetical protein